MIGNANNLVTYLSSLLVLVILGQCKPLQKAPKTLVPYVTVTPDSVSPGQINICKDFVHTIREDGGEDYVGMHKTFNVGPKEIKEILQDLLKENWKRQIGKQFRRFTKMHVPCKATIKMLKKQRIVNYIGINHEQRQNYTSRMELYMQASKLSLLLSVLTSEGLNKCCLQDSHLDGLHRKFKNRMVANLYHTVSQEMTDWTVSQCYMRASMVKAQPMRCEDVTHMIAVLLNDSVRTAKKLWKDMKREVKDMGNA